MFLLLDIGGSKIRWTTSNDKNDLSEVKFLNTPENFDDALAIFKDIAKDVSSISAVSCGIAGVLDKEKTKLINSPNLPNWVQKQLKTELENIFKAPAYLENDAAFAALGEANRGAGQNKNIVVYITVGTGVGGARIVESAIDRNSLGFEPGQQIIAIDNEPKSLESLISGSALIKKYGKRPEDITDQSIWDAAAKNLAYGLHNSIMHWSPDIVILGGSMMKSTGIPIEKVRTYLRSILTIFPYIPPVEKSLFGDLSGLYGALDFINRKQRTPLSS